MSAPIPNPVPAPADATGGAAPAAPAKKPQGLIRWGALIFLVVGFLAFAFVGAGPVTKWAVQKYGAQGLGTEVKLESASFNVFKLSVSLKGFRAVDPVDASKNQFEAEEIRATLDPMGCLKGQLVVAEAAVVKPKGRLVRNVDGTIGTEPPPTPPEGTPEGEVPAWKKKMEEEARKRDLIEDVKKLLEKAKKKHDEVIAKREAEEKRRQEQGVTDWKGRASYVRPVRPLIVVRKVLMEGVELVVEDKATGAPPQSITDATIEVTEWSSAPTLHDQPMQVKLDGKFGGAADSAVKLAGLLDLRSDDALTKIDANLANIPLAALDPYLKQLPVAFQGASIGTFNVPLTLKGYDIDWKPSMLLDKVEARARQPGTKIAGFESERVAQELTNAGRLLLDSIRVHGPIWSPTVEGDAEAVKQLVMEGGKAYAAKQAKKVVDEQAQKLLDKNPALKKQLEDTGVSKVLEGTASGVSGTAKEAAEKAFDFFGGKKK